MNPFTAKTIRSRKSNVEAFAALTRRREIRKPVRPRWRISFSGEQPFAPTKELHNLMTLSSRRACPNMLLLFGASVWYTCSGVLHVNLQAALSPRSGHCDLGCSSKPCVRRCFQAPCVLFRSFRPAHCYPQPRPFASLTTHNL